jgi:glycosyltransferase involved in cell wall biosynthesis
MSTPRFAGSDTDRTIGYVLKGFPRASELFIASEVHRLEARGMRLRLFVIKTGQESLRHEVVDRIRAVPEYLPQVDSVSAVPLRLWLASNAAVFVPSIRRVLRRHPVRTLRASTTAIALSIRMRPRLLGPVRKVYVKELLLAIALADRVMDAPDLRQLHAHFCHGATTVTWLAAMIVGLPFSFTAHAKDIYCSSLNPNGLLERKLAAARFAVTCTEANRQHLQRYAARTPVHRIYHGLNVEFSSLVSRDSSRQPPRDGSFHVLGVGRLVPKKGFDVFVEACGLLARRGVPVSATIVGEPDEHAEDVDERVVRLGLTKQVQRRPAMGQAALYDEYRRASVFCLPCRILENGDRDGIPNVLLEAMATGVPVVTTNVSGIPELVTDGVTGLLVPPDDPEATAAALLRLFADPDLAARLGRAGQALVRERFDGDRLAGELAALFERGVA